MLKRNLIRKFVTTLTPALLVLAALPTLGARRESGPEQRVASVLREEVFSGSFNPAYDGPLPLIIRVKEELFLDDLKHRESMGRDLSNMLPVINGYAVELTRRQIEYLIRSDAIEYVTLDPVVRTAAGPGGNPDSNDSSDEMGLSSYATILGADQVSGHGSKSTVAVFDSGVAEHHDLKKMLDKSFDFVGINGVELKGNEEVDAFGHGTHVSGIISGEGKSSDDQKGISKANILSLRVIGDEGWGRTSDLIRAINWVINNKDKYKIVVGNLSLGHPAFQSYRDDPLCQAVRRMVDAGIVAVVSAGNMGKLSGYPKVWGAITSPGIEPSAITVGAVNTMGTLTHKDDIATSYSSRGPTIDGLFKPDLVAPGNAIIAPMSELSWLEVNYPGLVYDEDYIRMSGTSMAAGFVSGVAARILERNKDLSPNQVKLILLLTAIKLDSPHLLEQGNGLVNAKTAVDLAKEIDVKKQELKKEVDPFWYLSLDGEKCKEDKLGPHCEPVWAGGAFAYSDRVVNSPLVQASSDKLWGSGMIWSEGLFWTDGFYWAESFFAPGSDIWDRTTGSGMMWTDGMIWSEGLFWADGMMWTDRLFSAKGMIWSEGLVWLDSVESDGSHVLGDQ